MLYELWRNVAGARRDELALRDAASGRRWTFGELFAAGDGAPVSDPALQSGFAFPQGRGPEFILDLLATWRDGKIVCTLEPGQSPPQVPPPPASCVHLKMTSATTGAARVVAFTAGQLVADAENIVATMGLRSDWPNLGVISMAHSYGFSNLVLPLLLHGIPLIICPSPLPEAVRRAAVGANALTLPAVPAMWRAWHDANAIPPNVRLAISAGAPLPASLEQTIFAARGVKIHNFYGSTECGGIAYDASPAPRTEDALAGAPLRNVNLSFSSDGRLTVQSHAVGETYLPEPDPNLGHGQFQTSDLAELQDGRVYLRGRVGDFINVAGRKVSPLIIERELSAHSAVGDCVVFGVPDRDGERGDLIVAAVVPQSPVTGEALRSFLLERLPAWQIPRDWLLVETLTSNRLGKISRAEWRKTYEATRPRA
jgi:acyl-CoA synthetase (AMP-forming)/AMP-acid ligase II